MEINIIDKIYELGDFNCPLHNVEWCSCNLNSNISCPDNHKDDCDMPIGHKIPDNCPLRKNNSIVIKIKGE